MVIVACLALALAGGQFRPRGFGPYSVSVPLDFRPYDPARWAIMNAGSYADARVIDPTLPDPRSVDFAAASAQPPVDPATLRDEAFVGPPAKPYVFRGATALAREPPPTCLPAPLYSDAPPDNHNAT